MQTFETADANVCVKMHKRLRENAHIFGSMGKMQLLHGAFGNTDGIPPWAILFLSAFSPAVL